MDRIKSVFIFDKIRILKLMEMIQYSSLYIIIGSPLAYVNNIIFPPLDETKSKAKIIIEIFLQLLLMAIFFYYLKKIVKAFPYIFSFFSKTYIPYRTDEYLGYAIGAYSLFIYLQKNLFDKINYINAWLY